MSLEVLPFTTDHLDAAAALLAARHRRDRHFAPALPARYEEPAAASTVLASMLAQESVVGAVARRGGAVVGYLLGLPSPIDPGHPFAAFARPRAAQIPIAGHATVTDDAHAICVALYTAIAAQWLAAGLDAHYIRVPAGDQAGLATWFALGFGHDLTLAARDTSPPPSSPAVTVRAATMADVDVLADQAVAILDEMTAAPTFLPPPPHGARAALHDWIAELLTDPALAQWIARHGGEAVGMQLFAACDGEVDEVVTPDRAIYLLGAYTTPTARGQGVGRELLAQAIAWARDAGYAWCVLDYLPANPAGARFWERHHFQPLVYRLCRQLDSRVIHARQLP